MLWWHYFLLFGAGLFVGFINTIAGSGSFLSLPILIFTGMPAVWQMEQIVFQFFLAQ